MGKSTVKFEISVKCKYEFLRSSISNLQKWIKHENNTQFIEIIQRWYTTLIMISIYLNLIDELINQLSPGVQKHAHRYKFAFWKIKMGRRFAPPHFWGRDNLRRCLFCWPLGIIDELINRLNLNTQVMVMQFTRK